MDIKSWLKIIGGVILKNLVNDFVIDKNWYCLEFGLTL